MSLEVRREEYGDIVVTKPDGDMTVAELIEALGHMPPDAIVRGIEQVSYEHPTPVVNLQ